MGIEMEAFRDRDHVVAEIKKCALAATVITYMAIIFVVIGVVADLSDWTIFLGTTSWFLLAIFAAVFAVIPNIHLIMAKHLLGAEVIKK